MTPALPQLAAASLLLTVLAGGSGYLHGLSVAKARAEAIAARVITTQQAANARLAEALDAANAAAVAAERARQEEAEGIADEARRLAADPQYQHSCLDARGLRLLEAAAANANRAH